MGGDDEGVALVVGLVTGTTVAMPPAATAAARDELGGEANGVGWLVAGGVGLHFGPGGWQVCFGSLEWPVRGWLLEKFWSNYGYCGVGWHCIGWVNLLDCPPPWEKLQWVG